MAPRISRACVAVATACVAWGAARAFLVPAASRASVAPTTAVGELAPTAGHWGMGVSAVALVLGAHAGLAAFSLRKTTRKAEGESAKDQRLFEQVFLQYTSEYLKGPMYWTQYKRPMGPRPFDLGAPESQRVYIPGEPMTKNGQMTSVAIGPYRNFSSAELAFLSLLFLGIGLYGNFMFLFFDPQFNVVQNGGYFNPLYIIEAQFLPFSWAMHIACYVQKRNGK